jgi:glycosyltransferase involved in cell wall biosynthesis
MKVALVYDRINKFGGAERVLEALHQIWPDAPLYTAVYHPGKATWAKKFTVIPSALNHLAFLRDKHEYLAPLMPYVFEQFSFDQYDCIISVTSAEAKGIITRPDQLHLSYILTPTRYLWSHTHFYQQGSLPWLKAYFLSNLRRWDFLAAQRPDHLVAISETVAARIRKYYRRQVAAVIYPPVEVDYFKAEPKTPKDYYLFVSRLVPYKKPQLVIDAFNQMPDKKLVIVGTGSEFERLLAQAGPNVILKGWVETGQLKKLYQEAKALIFPQEEDFGITALEAQAAGTPVIAYNRGGATETIIPDQTGLLFDEPTPQAIMQAIAQFETREWPQATITKHAQKFSQTIFTSQFKNLVEDLWHQHPR